MPNSRASKEPAYLNSFSKEILVCCPNCGKKANVTGAPNKEFRCSNCFTPIDESRWYGLVNIFVNTGCGQCGVRISKRISGSKLQPSQLDVTCNACGTTRSYPTSIRRIFADSTNAVDPWFGLPLWLTETVGSNVFWAYNYEHLAHLKQFVSAKLREKSNDPRLSYTEKLPAFITTAKNRDRILKAISRLERK